MYNKWFRINTKNQYTQLHIYRHEHTYTHIHSTSYHFWLFPGWDSQLFYWKREKQAKKSRTVARSSRFKPEPPCGLIPVENIALNHKLNSQNVCTFHTTPLCSVFFCALLSLWLSFCFDFCLWNFFSLLPFAFSLLSHIIRYLSLFVFLK